MRNHRGPNDWESTARPPDATKRCEIQINRGRLAEVVDQAEIALINAEANVYVRGEMLVRVVQEPIGQKVGAGVHRPEGAPKIVPHTAVSIADHLNRHGAFQKWNQRSDRWQPADCPKSVADTLLSRVETWPFPRLTALVYGATLRPDGTVLTKPGFDKATGFLVLEGLDLPLIPGNPSPADAKAALALLDELLEEFPFVGPNDRSVALAMLITAVVRASMPTAPMFAISAPTPGTGKSYLADLAAVLATGRRAAVVGASCDEDELEKRLGASFMAGDPVLNLDNLDRALKSERLCQVLSQETVKFRILGRSTNIDTPTNSVMIATGNAIRVHSDLTRRVLLILLDASEERPELRRFRSDPVQTAIANRGKYVAAVLIILRAFMRSDTHPLSPALGSFGKWSDWVRSALVWLGQADPALAMDSARATDPERERTAEILASLQPEGTWTVRELTQRLATTSFMVAELREALAGFLKDGKLDGHAFGNWCAKKKNRPVNGMTLREAGIDSKAKVKRWHVDEI